MIPYYDEIMNHDDIGSLACMPSEPKMGNVRPGVSLNLWKCNLYTVSDAGWPWHMETGIWLSIIPDRENTGNLGTTQGKFGQHSEFSKFP